MYVFVVVVVVDVVCNGSSLAGRFEVPYHQSLFELIILLLRIALKSLRGEWAVKNRNSHNPAKKPLVLA